MSSRIFVRETQDVSIYEYSWGPSKATSDPSAFPLHWFMVISCSRIFRRFVWETRLLAFIVASSFKSSVGFYGADGSVGTINFIGFACPKYTYHLYFCDKRHSQVSNRSELALKCKLERICCYKAEQLKLTITMVYWKSWKIFEFI